MSWPYNLPVRLIFYICFHILSGSGFVDRKSLSAFPCHLNESPYEDHFLDFRVESFAVINLLVKAGNNFRSSVH